GMGGSGGFGFGTYSSTPPNSFGMNGGGMFGSGNTAGFCSGTKSMPTSPGGVGGLVSPAAFAGSGSFGGSASAPPTPGFGPGNSLGTAASLSAQVSTIHFSDA